MSQPREEDELLQPFLTETREHLDGIESDLLSIEAGGENIDDDLVNKVFRAVHSLKGGAGFFGLDNAQSLAHAMESLLGLIRKREMVPTPAVISLLLKGADSLLWMINNIERSNETDISDLLAKLGAALTQSLPEEQKDPGDETLEIGPLAGQTVFTVRALDLERSRRAEKGGDFTYLIEYDLIKDIQRKSKTPQQIISELAELTSLVDWKVDIEAVGTLDQPLESTVIPFFVLVSSQIDPELFQVLLDLPPERVHQISLATSGKRDERAVTEVPERAEPDSPARVAPDQGPSAPPAPESKPPPSDPPIPGEPAQGADKASRHGSRTEHTESSDSTSRPTCEESIRVNLGVLDKLVTLAGELVLTRNQLTRSVGVDDAKTTAATQRLDLITTQLEDVIISTRMQSIDLVFHKFRRLVRDLSKSLGKKVELILQGEDVELDKTIIEAINDPLTHLVRNSLDHGIELPRERVEAGKPAQGVLRLSAYNKAGHVVIEIEDDGRGIDPQKVKARALAQGLYTANQLDAMSDEALVRLIFKPGFSMASNVTEISGRGVGMDVVNSNLTRLGGVVNVESIVGRGTVMRVKLPLTLAIIPCVLVSEGGEFFAIPQFNLIEFHRIPPREIKSRIKKLGDVHVMRLRGKLLPLLYLRDVLGIETTTSTPKSIVKTPDRHAPIADGRVDVLENPAPVETERRKHPDPDQDGHGTVHIVIVAAGNFHFGLIVDRLQDSLEVVAKPLGRHLRDCHAYAGATILGDGRSALILDVTGISKALKSDNAAYTTTQADTGVVNVEKQQDSMTVLVVENAENERFAIPLGLVERVERIRKCQIQVRAGKKTMTYQGKNLLLLSVEDVVDVPPRKDTEEVYTVVFRIRDREVGLLVSDLIEILDSKEETDVITHTQKGIFGSMLIDGRATLLLDIQGIAAAAIPNLKVTAKPTPQTADKERHTVLLVEDSKFFLGKISGFIEEAGHTALTAEDGLAAIEVLEREEGNVDLVLTDIVMPRLDGFAMTERIRSDPRFQNIPVIAVTSVIGTDARQRAREVGIDQYLNKLDREQIMERCNHYLKHGRAA